MSSLEIKGIEAVAVLLLVLGIFGYGVHTGRKMVENADAAAVLTQQNHDAKVIADASAPLLKTVAALRAQLAAAPAAAAPHVRLCIPSSAPHVPAVHSAGPPPPSPPAEPTVVPGPDVGPVLDKRYADDDARVAALQSYIEACIASGRCAQPVATVP